MSIEKYLETFFYIECRRRGQLGECCGKSDRNFKMFRAFKKGMYVNSLTFRIKTFLNLDYEMTNYEMSNFLVEYVRVKTLLQFYFIVKISLLFENLQVLFIEI